MTHRRGLSCSRACVCNRYLRACGTEALQLRIGPRCPMLFGLLDNAHEFVFFVVVVVLKNKNFSTDISTLLPTSTRIIDHIFLTIALFAPFRSRKYILNFIEISFAQKTNKGVYQSWSHFLSEQKILFLTDKGWHRANDVHLCRRNTKVCILHLRMYASNRAVTRQHSSTAELQHSSVNASAFEQIKRGE